MHCIAVPKRKLLRCSLVVALLLISVGALAACEADIYDPPRGDPSLLTAALDDSHPGWLIPDCSTCHNEIHGAAIEVGHCGLCHGGNGGPQLTEAHPGWESTGCTGCHSNVVDHAAGLEDIGCGSCHGDNGGALEPATNPAPQLTDTHFGWLNADCGICHSASGTHGGMFELPACGACHGSNGGPLRPDNHWLTDCNDCHASGPEPWNACSHTGYELDAPRSCRYCHK